MSEPACVLPHFSAAIGTSSVPSQTDRIALKVTTQEAAVPPAR